MPDSSPRPESRSEDRGSGFPTPWGYFKRRQNERFERERQELHSYLEIAVPFALSAEELYQRWRETVSDPVQDSQKAANFSATYWWTITERLTRFRETVPPPIAARYHKLFLDALVNASTGTEIAKNGFRYNKFAEVSRGIGHLDRYVELMADAELELKRLVKKFRLVEDPIDDPHPEDPNPPEVGTPRPVTPDPEA